MVSRESAIQGTEALPAQARPQKGPISVFASFARRKPIGAISAVFLVVILLLAIGAPVVATHDPVATATQEKLQAPSSRHYMGTDELGRDVFSRLLHGARISLVVGYGGMLVTVVLSTAIAVTSAYFGRKTDLVFQRFVDGFMAIPGLLVILAVVTILDPTVFNVMLVLGILYGIRESRVVRSGVLGVKAMPYIEAAHAIGAGLPRLVMRYILPNIFYIIIVIGSLVVGRIIILEASVSFLGLGIPPPTPTWGQMLGGTARTFMTQAPWMGIAPGLAISFTVLAFNMLGDALRDVLDPRLRGAEARGG
jgi:peptide/nickel transport system permease protein